MITAKCIQKFKDNQGKIYSYELIDLNGQTRTILADELKKAIQVKRINVINLTLTSDNRLVDASQKQLKSQLLNKSSALNKRVRPKLTRDMVKKIDSVFNLSFDVVTNLEEYVSIFKSNVTYPYMYLSEGVFAYKTPDKIVIVTETPIEIDNSFSVKGIDDIFSEPCGLFEDTKFMSIDLGFTNTSKVTDMSRMFYNCRAYRINLSDINTSKVTDMSRMFERCEACKLNLSGLNTSEVTNMEKMFYRCQNIENLDLSCFDTSRVKNMKHMFKLCKIYRLDISTFTDNNKEYMDMFRFAKITHVKITDQKILEDFNKNKD